MRIITGRYKGRSLQGPTGPGVRPTSDRLRETIFNIVDMDRPQLRVLDGFAGTGALGLEALSRGAVHATFVDKDPRALAVLKRNVEACGASDACVIIRGDFSGFARRFAGGGFDLALLDPPYDFNDPEAVLADASLVLRPDGLIVFEHSKRRALPDTTGALVKRRLVTAGDSALAFYGFAPTAPPPTDSE